MVGGLWLTFLNHSSIKKKKKRDSFMRTRVPGKESLKTNILFEGLK